MKAQFIFVLMMAFCLSIPLVAQDESSQNVDMGTIVTGRIDNASPRAVYNINGSRGAVVRIRLSASSGNLDPVLTVFDPLGRLLFRRDDTAGSLNVETTITFQENGVYALVVGRFGYSLGTSSGEYELSIERVGVTSQEGTALLYGEAVLGTISNSQPQIFYTFQANEGDILNISMIRSSGTLDPYLQVVDANRFLIAENDDAYSETRNALIQGMVIGETGTYIVIASRYGQAAGESVGSFVILVEESQNSGLGNSRLAPALISLNQTVDGEITPERWELFYRFEGIQNQIITITMDRTIFAGQLDAYLILADGNFQPLVENDDSLTGSNSRIESFRLPATGVYHIIATRFGRSEGTSYGPFRLSLLDEGFAFETVNEGIPRLLYGTNVEDSISDADPDSLFVFWGEEGEQIIIAMDALEGNLDPYLELLDANQVRMLFDDDGGSERNARIETTLTYTGVHYIRASRYAGSSGDNTTAGTYRLNLVRVSN